MRRLLVACLLLGACTAPEVARTTLVEANRTTTTLYLMNPPENDAVLDPYPADQSTPADVTTSSTTTTTVAEPTTTTTVAPRPPVTAASRSRGSTVQSTAYCLTGHMANGQPTHVGAVAGNQWPLGTVLEVSDSPYGPGRFTVEDRIGWGSELDFATPADCGLATQWGRRSITVEVVG